MHAIDADQQNVFDVVSIVGAGRCGDGCTDKPQAQGKCKDSLFQAGLLWLELGLKPVSRRRQ
jgi:hypothetical protein